ncbi:MAG: 3-oxoacyl-[acyl-carrier-protein] synthase III C-terminal domain-containing protein [Vicinamibacteria bacterium]
MPSLTAIETRSASFKHHQSDVTAGVLRWLGEIGADVDPRTVERLFSRAGVENRASLTSLDQVFADVSFADRNRLYQNAMIEAGIALSKAAITAAGVSNVDLIVSSSCTGFMIPAVDAHIANALHLGPRLIRLPITEAGCAGGAVALARAGDYVQAHPESAALVVAVEFSSLTFQARDASPTNLVATALFADGGGAAVLLGRNHPAVKKGALRFIGTASYFMNDSLGSMGYDVVERGLKLVLDKRLPDSLRGRLRPMVTEFLGQNGLALEDVAAFSIHPGGRKVLDVAAEDLGLNETLMEPSRSVLRDHGNMSSATILFVLQRAIAQLPPGGTMLGIGFGPGFSIELSLWRSESMEGSA